MLLFGDEGDEACGSEDTGTSVLKRFRVDMTRKMCMRRRMRRFAALLSREEDLGPRFARLPVTSLFTHRHDQHSHLQLGSRILVLFTSCVD